MIRGSDLRAIAQSGHLVPALPPLLSCFVRPARTCLRLTIAVRRGRNLYGHCIVIKLKQTLAGAAH